MKKKILVLCLIVALSATAIVGGTLAYFTDREYADNTFTVGNVTIELTEPKWDQNRKDPVYPGEVLDKDPTVKNIGANPCFVRIHVRNLDQFKSGEYGEYITYRTDSTDNKLGDNWVRYEDPYDNNAVYYYYNRVLEVDASTDALFDQIVMPTSLYGGEETKPIYVCAEAVQAQGAKAQWADVEKMTVKEISAWFDTCYMNSKD